MVKKGGKSGMLECLNNTCTVQDQSKLYPSKEFFNNTILEDISNYGVSDRLVELAYNNSMSWVRIFEINFITVTSLIVNWIFDNKVERDNEFTRITDILKMENK